MKWQHISCIFLLCESFINSNDCAEDLIVYWETLTHYIPKCSGSMSDQYYYFRNIFYVVISIYQKGSDNSRGSINLSNHIVDPFY